MSFSKFSGFSNCTCGPVTGEILRYSDFATLIQSKGAFLQAFVDDEF